MTIRPLTIVLTLIAMTLITIVAIPPWRSAVRDYFVSDERVLVAKIEGRLSPEGPAVIILKIKNRDQFFIEIYKANQNLELMQRIALEEPLDGQYYFQGRYTNLSLADIDGDHTYEIVVPMYDKNAVPRLLIFQYNASLETFEKLTGE